MYCMPSAFDCISEHQPGNPTINHFLFSQLEPLAFEGSRNGEGDAIPYSLPGTDTDPDPDAAQAHQTPPEVALVQPDMIPEEWRAVGRAQIAIKHKEARGQISEPNQLAVPRSHPWPLGCVAPLLACPTAAAKTVKVIANIPALTTHNVYIPDEQYRPNFDKEEGIYTVYGPGGANLQFHIHAQTTSSVLE
ncbi:hypothetical protein DFH27DRAFT_529330 [Peziza echinospora]|nr:hypothetical protein DFH27DRAFT_529330 [Peziza echinospora]